MSERRLSSGRVAYLGEIQNCGSKPALPQAIKIDKTRLSLPGRIMFALFHFFNCRKKCANRFNLFDAKVFQSYVLSILLMALPRE